MPEICSATGERATATSTRWPHSDDRQRGVVVTAEPGQFRSIAGPPDSAVAAASDSALKGQLTILFSRRPATECAADVLALHADTTGCLTSDAIERLVASPLMISNNRSSEGILFDVMLRDSVWQLVVAGRRRRGCGVAPVSPRELVLAPLPRHAAISPVVRVTRHRCDTDETVRCTRADLGRDCDFGPWRTVVVSIGESLTTVVMRMDCRRSPQAPK